jgi:ethanolamine utilization protein EutN
MKIGRVIGSVEGAVKHPAYNGATMLVVQPLDLQKRPRGRTQPAMDMVGAGAGDLVLLVEEGKAARERSGEKNIPVRTLIVGIVDEMSVMALEKTTTERVV